MPEGVDLVPQPPYNPELPPAENFWELADEELVNHCFESIQQMEDVLGQCCCELVEQTERILSRTLSAWWPLSPAVATV